MSAGAGLACRIAGVALGLLLRLVGELGGNAFALGSFAGLCFDACPFFRFGAGDRLKALTLGTFSGLAGEPLLPLLFLFFLANFARFQNLTALFLARDHFRVIIARPRLEAREQRLLRFIGRIPAFVEVFLSINCHSVFSREVCPRRLNTRESPFFKPSMAILTHNSWLLSLSVIVGTIRLNPISSGPPPPYIAAMATLSVLDLAPIFEGGDASQSLANSLDLARHAEKLGYRRYWLAEHHNMPGIASAATAVVIGHIAGGTSTIRVGAGGIMLPNHAPLVIAEQFGTLAALYPGRIDLGLGRAPGTDMATARALRRNLDAGVDSFPHDVVELINYFAPAEAGQAVRAIPGEGQQVPVWILGSSLYGAQLAAMLGLPYAFASHFAPTDMDRAIEVYRTQFQPSQFLEKPYLMMGLNVCAGETDAEARDLFSSLQQAFVAMRTNQRGKLKPPVPNYFESLDPMARAMLDQTLSLAVVGDGQTVKRGVDAFVARTGADELMVTAQIYDHEKRKRSYEILAEISGQASQAA